MNIFERFGSIAAAGRGSRPSRPRIPGKVRAWVWPVGMGSREDGAGQSDEQASSPPMVAASFNAGDRQV